MNSSVVGVNMDLRTRSPLPEIQELSCSYEDEPVTHLLPRDFAPATHHQLTLVCVGLLHLLLLPPSPDALRQRLREAGARVNSEQDGLTAGERVL